MAFFGKTYNLVNQENFDGWLKSIGLPDDKVNFIVSQKSTNKIVQNGDSYSLFQTGAGGDRETVFKSGVEFDDSLGADKNPVKSTYTVSGNTVTQTISGPRGTAIFKREFNGDDLLLTITGDKFDGVCKRFYKA